MVHMQRMAHPGGRMPGPMNPVVSEFNVRTLDHLRSLQFESDVLLLDYNQQKVMRKKIVCDCVQYLKLV